MLMNFIVWLPEHALSVLNDKMQENSGELGCRAEDAENYANVQQGNEGKSK